MATARIFQNQPVGSPVHQPQRAGWMLEFASDTSPHPDPLTGWAGGSEPQSYVRLSFPDKETAIAYCEREGFAFVVQHGPRRKLLLQSYADNFR